VDFAARRGIWSKILFLPGKIFEGAMAFIMRKPPQGAGRPGVNAPGVPVILLVIFEELLVNVLIHRDYRSTH